MRNKLKKRGGDYSPQERHVLLTGVPLTPWSTRFGHPIHGGWKLEEIRAAWQQLSLELRIEWQGSKYASHRTQHGRPFAERILSDD